MNKSNKQILRKKRVKRTRMSIQSAKQRLRLAVFRSNKHIYAQIVDDLSGKTLVAFSDQQVKNQKKGRKTDIAYEIGKRLGKLAIDKKITECAFDRRWYKYHGRIKYLAEGVKKTGLKL